jgi:hypothetical protein
MDERDIDKEGEKKKGVGIERKHFFSLPVRNVGCGYLI